MLLRFRRGRPHSFPVQPGGSGRHAMTVNDADFPNPFAASRAAWTVLSQLKSSTRNM